jgi:hypothetical protein
MFDKQLVWARRVARFELDQILLQNLHQLRGHFGRQLEIARARRGEIHISFSCSRAGARGQDGYGPTSLAASRRSSSSVSRRFHATGVGVGRSISASAF